MERISGLLTLFSSTFSTTDISTLIFGVFIFALLTWLIQRHQSASKLPPGPTGWPIIGCIPRVLLSDKLLHETMADISSRYGDVCSMYLGNTLVVVLNGYDVIKEGFQSSALCDRPYSALFEDNFEGQGITFNSGQSWKELRHFTTGTLRSFGVGKRSYEEHVIREARHLTNCIANQSGTSFNPSSAISNTVTNSICSAVLGFRYEFDDPTYQKLLQSLEENTRLSGGSFLLNVLPASSFFFRSTQQKIVANLHVYKDIFQPIIDEHRRNLNPNDLNDFVSAYLHECKVSSNEKEQTNINEKHLMFLIIQLFAAGTETVASTLLWALLLVTKYPDVQRKVQDELDSVVGRSRLPDLKDRLTLPYTEAVLLEIQRFGSIVPLGVPHSAGSTIMFRGYTIPKGSIIMGNLWAAHHDPTVWKHPDKFEPERFLKDGKVIQRENIIPFSIGKRVCIGEQLAKMELFVFFTHLLHQFKWRNPDDAPELSLKAAKSAGHTPEAYSICAEHRE